MYLQGPPQSSAAPLGDDLGFSIGGLFKTVGKAVSDVANEAKRAAKNPLVQTAASFAVPALAPLAIVQKGLNVAHAVQSSGIGRAVGAVQSVQRAGGSTVDAASAGLTAIAPNSTLARAARAQSKAAEGERIKAANAAKAAAAAAATAQKKADQDAKRAAKAAEGERIKAENAAKEAAAAAQKKADQDARRAAKVAQGEKIKAANEAKRLQEQAAQAAKDGQDAIAKQLRDQADAIAANARAISVPSSSPVPVNAADYQNPVAVVPAPDAPATAAPAINPAYIALGGVVLLGGLYAVSKGGGASGAGRTWR
jgi:hypothetical protein